LDGQSRIELTESDLIEALLAAQASECGADGALTVWEMVEQSGLSDTLVRRRLRKMMDRLECVKVMRVRIDGLRMPVPAYRLKC